MTRAAPRVAPVLARLGSRRLKAANEPVAVAQAMATLLAGRPADQIAAFLEASLERAGPETGNWDTRAAVLWVLVADAMLKIPTRHPPAATVREIREFFRDDHVHPALIVSPAGHLAAVVVRDDITDSQAPDAVAAPL